MRKLTDKEQCEIALFMDRTADVLDRRADAMNARAKAFSAAPPRSSDRKHATFLNRAATSNRKRATQMRTYAVLLMQFTDLPLAEFIAGESSVQEAGMEAR